MSILLILCLILGVLLNKKGLDEFGNNEDPTVVSEDVDNSISDYEDKNEQLNKSIQEHVNKYNDMINEYNEKAEKYNALIDSMVSRVDITLPDKVSLVTPISTNSISLYDENFDRKLINDMEMISSDIKDLISKEGELRSVIIEALVKDYNLLADEYNRTVVNTSIHYISGISENCVSKNAIDYSDSARLMDNNSFIEQVDSILNDINSVVGDYYLVKQITDPNPNWVERRLENIPDISGVQGVTENDDPNGLLGKDGGYSGCLYFTVRGIAANITGDTIIEKGTDAGGAIEIYHTVRDAENRCDYLAQFDNTLLYSGSYVIVGTMVVRTSYQLSNQSQIELTNKIIEELTRIDVNDMAYL